MPSLILGTATFVPGYGIANSENKPDKHKIAELVKASQQLQINEFDTAPNYGEAESLLGDTLDHSLDPKISSKISSKDCKSVDEMLTSVKSTLLRTRVKSLRNLYLHEPNALSGEYARETIEGLKEILATGLADRVGISVYSLRELLEAKDRFPQLSVFQVPENICDRRMLYSTEVEDLQKKGDHFIIRSIFLQGLLLMHPHDLPSKLKEATSSISELRALADSFNILPIDLCLAYSRAIPWASGVIIGATDPWQIRQLARSNFQLPNDWAERIKLLPEDVLDPRLW